MNEKRTITKQELGERLYFLNWKIKELKEQEQDKSIQKQVEKLYELKNKVLIKLLAEGRSSVGARGYAVRGFYSLRMNKTFSFHLPISKEITKAVHEHRTRKKKGIHTAS